MCWSGEASVILATVGFASSAYAAYKKEPLVLCVSLAYFSLMEMLQAYTYSVINHCEMPANQVATLLGYFHICFQPFFVNAVSLYFLPKEVAKKIAPVAYTVCFIAMIVMLLHVFPFSWAGKCTPGHPLCGDILCSIRGSWHIAWVVPTNSIADNWPGYTLVAFMMPAFYGSWRFTVYHLLTGPLLASMTTSSMNEMPAVWCLLSIGLLLLVVKTRIRKFLHVRSFWLWKLWGWKKQETGTA